MCFLYIIKKKFITLQSKKSRITSSVIFALALTYYIIKKHQHIIALTYTYNGTVRIDKTFRDKVDLTSGNFPSKKVINTMENSWPKVYSPSPSKLIFSSRSSLDKQIDDRHQSDTLSREGKYCWNINS